MWPQILSATPHHLDLSLPTSLLKAQNPQSLFVPTNPYFQSPFKWIEYGVYADLILMYPKPYSIYLRGTIPLYSPTYLSYTYILGGSWDLVTIWVRAHRSPCCFLCEKVARNLGLSAIWRKNMVLGRLGNYCRQDKISFFVTLCFGF